MKYRRNRQPASSEFGFPPVEGYLSYQEHSYPTCFVCGPQRPGHDGLCLFPGPVDDWTLLACPWRPAADLLDESGNVRPEIVWSALDCPGFYAATGDTLVPVLLGELTAELRAPVPGDKPLVVFCWPLGREGRKLCGGVAIANQDGEVLACSRSIWIVQRLPKFSASLAPDDVIRASPTARQLFHDLAQSDFGSI